MNKKILTIGEVNADIIFSGLSHLPRAEQDVIAPDFNIVVGGQTGTIARALSRLGMVVHFVGRVGDDGYGAMAVDQLRMDGVDASYVIADTTVRTGVTVVLSTGRERAYATYLGSMAAIEPDDVHRALEHPADHMHVGSYYLQTKLRPALPSLFAEAHDLGLTTSIDPGWDSFNQWQPDIFDVLSYTDLFLPNEVEALTITSTDTIEEALDALAPYGGMTVIKMGGKGCLIRHQSRTISAPPFPVEVVDVTSAGDVFNAGFLYGYLAGWPLGETARFANACGAIAVTRVGSLGLVSGVEEVEDFLAARGEPPLSEGVE